MQYTLALQPGRPIDFASIGRLLDGLDPASLLDVDRRTGTIRISTVATERELLDSLREAGIAVADEGLVRLPAECCGGCGG